MLFIGIMSEEVEANVNKAIRMRTKGAYQASEFKFVFFYLFLVHVYPI
jgi:hypothetical protein